VHRWTTHDPWPPTTRESALLLVEKCLWHGVLPLLFAEAELPPIVKSARETARGWQWALAARTRSLNDVIVGLCDTLAGEPFMLIKGGDYGRRLYPEMSLRPMQDIDILVPSARIDEVGRRVQRAGYTLMPSAGAVRDPAHHERGFFKGDILVEVHQAFTQRPRHRIDYDAIWQRRVPLEIQGRQAARLDDVDALAYQGVSMATDQLFVRFIRFVDLWLLLHQRDGIALAAAERARDWQATHALYATFSQACRLFPGFRTPEVTEAMARVLSVRARRFIDRWVLPEPAEVRSTRRPRRWLQLWRKVCLMDTSVRRGAFALSHAMATIRAWL
jgi:hypothetical protein